MFQEIVISARIWLLKVEKVFSFRYEHFSEVHWKRDIRTGDPLIAPGTLQTEKNYVFGGSAVENGSPSTIWGVKCCRNFYFLKQQQKLPTFCKKIFSYLASPKSYRHIQFLAQNVSSFFFWHQFECFSRRITQPVQNWGKLRSTTETNFPTWHRK